MGNKERRIFSIEELAEMTGLSPEIVRALGGESGGCAAIRKTGPFYHPV